MSPSAWAPVIHNTPRALPLDAGSIAIHDGDGHAFSNAFRYFFARVTAFSTKEYGRNAVESRLS